MSIYSVNSVCGIIFPYLQDSEVKSLGLISKRILALAKRELLNRDEKLERLFAFYTMTHKFNVRSLREVDVLSIGEYHDDPICLKDQISLVVFLASRGPVILVLELWPSLKPVPVEDDLLLSQIHCSIDPFYRNNIYGIGWDDREEDSRLEQAIHQKYEEQQLILEQKWKDMRRVAEEELPKEVLLSQEDINEAFEATSSSKGNKGDFHSLLVRTILDKGRRFVSSIMRTIRSRGVDHCSRKILKDTILVQKVLSSLENEHREVEHAFLDLKRKKDAEFRAVTKQTFPIRTQGMVKTLEGLEDIKRDLAIPNAKAVLIAGGSHLDPINFRDDWDDDPYWDVRAFYAELGHHRAVVLTPMVLISAKQAEMVQLEAAREAERIKFEKKRKRLERKKAERLAKLEAREAAIRMKIQEREAFNSLKPDQKIN